MPDNVSDATPLVSASIPGSAINSLLREHALKQQLGQFQKQEHDNDGTIVDLAGDALYNAAYTGLQRPLRSVGQWIDDANNGKTKAADALTVMPKPYEASHGSKRYYAEQLGSGVGFFVPLAVTSVALKGTGLSLSARTEGLVASTGKLFSGANGVRVVDGAVTGFASDFFLSPVEASEGDHLKARLKHGTTSAAVMATMTAGSLGVRAISGSLATKLVGEGVSKQVGRLAYEGAVGITSGIPAGVASADVNARLWQGRWATAEERVNSAYTMAWTGGVLSAAHVLPTDRTIDPLAASRALKAQTKRDGTSSKPTAENVTAETPGSAGFQPAPTAARSSLLSTAKQVRTVELAELKAPDAPTIEHDPQPVKTQPAERTLRVEEFPSGRRVETYTYPDGKVVEQNIPSVIPGMGNTTLTKFPDGTTMLENRDGTYIEKPDGSYISVNSYRTFSSAEGEIPTKWAEAIRTWYQLTPKQKIESLSDIEAVPRGGNAAQELVERGMFDVNPAVQDQAISQIPKLKNSFAQVVLWKSAWGNFPELQGRLTEMLPELQVEARLLVDRTEGRKPSPEAVAIGELSDRYHELIKEVPVKFSDDQATRRAPLDLSARAERDGLSAQQVRETMQTVVDLLEIGKQYKDMEAARDYQMAALQILRQAADPLIITQGDHPTCAIASLETSMYTKTPEAAARLVSEVLRTGKFVTTDGTTIPIDIISLLPENRALEGNKTKFHDQKDIMGYRSYASQIFQTTAANIYWQRQEHTPFIRFETPHVQRVAVGSMRYEIRTRQNEKGKLEMYDAVVDYPNDQRRILRETPYVTTFRELEDMGRMIGGEASVPTVIRAKGPELASRQAFDNFISGLKPKDFPVIIGIDSDVLRDPTKPYSSSNHAISLLKSPDGQAYIHNTWRPFSDVHQPGYWINNKLTIDHLMKILNVK